MAPLSCAASRVASAPAGGLLQEDPEFAINHAKPKRSRLITLLQAAMKS